MKIILASGSPRRRELLKLVEDEFEIRVSDADESVPENIAAEKTAKYLSMVKANAVSRDDDELVIGCDTVVVIDGKVLGKPVDENDCAEMLMSLSGKIHTVYTGVSFIYAESSYSFSVKTDVEFYSLTEKEISEYISTGEPFDKAGGYGIQGRGALFVKGIYGDYYNVVGLPVSALKRELERFTVVCGNASGMIGEYK
ncbi:MAG: Maf family protein [Clostridium sp.]|nr:Maf family protein [Clostridium sp.]MCM1547314.1 Maf family protein [Ruminococcus sp.]